MLGTYIESAKLFSNSHLDKTSFKWIIFHQKEAEDSIKRKVFYNGWESLVAELQSICGCACAPRESLGGKVRSPTGKRGFLGECRRTSAGFPLSHCNLHTPFTIEEGGVEVCVWRGGLHTLNTVTTKANLLPGQKLKQCCIRWEENYMNLPEICIRRYIKKYYSMSLF